MQASTKFLVLLVNLSFLLIGFMLVGKSVVLFSPVHATVTVDGEEVRGAQVVQQVTWVNRDKSETQSTTTSDFGTFSLPLIKSKTIFGAAIPHEPKIKQMIFIQYLNNEYLVWSFEKNNYEKEGELNKPIHLNCDLNAERKTRAGVLGICEIV